MLQWKRLIVGQGGNTVVVVISSQLLDFHLTTSQPPYQFPDRGRAGARPLNECRGTAVIGS